MLAHAGVPGFGVPAVADPVSAAYQQQLALQQQQAAAAQGYTIDPM